MTASTTTVNLDPQSLAQLVAREMYARDRTAQYLGMRIDEVRPGCATLTMPLTDEMLNGHDIGHGGFIFSLADTAFAYACNSYNQATVALACTISYLAPARRGDVLTAYATEHALAGRTGVYDVKVTNQDDKEIAIFRGNSYRIKGEVIASD